MLRLTVFVDPGSTGGVAWQVTGQKIWCAANPKAEDRPQLFKDIFWEHGHGCRIVCGVEKVTGWVPDRRKAGSAEFRLEEQSHMIFNFGKGYGELLGNIRMAGVTPHDVSPRAWLNHFGWKKGGRKREAWKRFLKERAAERYEGQLAPGCRVTLKTCDALLGLEYMKTL